MNEITDRVDRLFAEWDKTDTPGASLAVIRDGKTIYERGYGLANLEYGIPNTPRTIFHVASMSKQFTAWAITHLASLGKLSLDDDIHRYLPEVPDFGEPITLRHLIHHTSGLRDQWSLLVLAGWRMDDVITTEDILEMVKGQRELNFKPGAEYVYCNTGYTLLGLIVKQVSGKSLREYCEEHLFRPLGMKDTHFHDDYQMIVPNRAYSYSKKPEGGYQHAVLSYSNVGATSLLTTVEDMALWDENFYTGKAGGMAVIEQMHCRGILNNGEMIDYAFGIVVGKYRGLRTVEHSGGDAGFATDILRFPDQHFSVVVLCNTGGVGPTAIARKIADIFLENDFKEPGLGESLEVSRPPEELAKFAGWYTNEASNQTFQIKYDAEKNQLTVELGRPLPIIPLEGDRLGVMGIAGLELEIKMTEDGTVEGFGLLMPGMSLEFYKRIRPTQYSPEDLARFAGIYTSQELGVSYNLAIVDGQLHVERRKYGSRVLEPTAPDTFVQGMTTFHFIRDPMKRPSGFLISTGRVRNLRFERLIASE